MARNFSACPISGLGQELLALLLLLRDNENPLMKHRVHRDRPKKIVLVNQRLDGSGRGFYDPFIDLIQRFGYGVDEDFHVVADEIEAINRIQDSRKTVGRTAGGRQRPSGTGWSNV